MYCAGGDAAPRNCKNNNFQHSTDWSKCVCKDGTYEEGGDCKDCPTGHMCMNGEKITCPLHTFQDSIKATACKPCMQDRDGDLLYSGCPANNQRQWCQPGTSVPQCVPCTRCRKAYLTRNAPQNPEDTEVDCYKNY